MAVRILQIAGDRWRSRDFSEITLPVVPGSTQKYRASKIMTQCDVTPCHGSRTFPKIPVLSRSYNIPRNLLNELLENFPLSSLT
eukprot:1340153-Amorphochlora_amoeboformis.AAC.1